MEAVVFSDATATSKLDSMMGTAESESNSSIHLFELSYCNVLHVHAKLEMTC